MPRAFLVQDLGQDLHSQAAWQLPQLRQLHLLNRYQNSCFLNFEGLIVYRLYFCVVYMIRSCPPMGKEDLLDNTHILCHCPSLAGKAAHEYAQVC
uniref:RNA-binding protein 5 isoform X4 n=1 Tax=Rhizophora mucronata TaxID=61149 RepID=A0A2P2MAC3_RHIMU